MKTKRNSAGQETEGLDWNTAIGLTLRLRQDDLVKDYLMLTLGIYTGLRISDLLNLKWEQLIDKDEVTIREKKTGKLRRITVNPKVKEALGYGRDQLQAKEKYRPDKYILESKYGSPPTVSYVNKRLKLLFTRYNVKARKASSHTLRKTFALRLWSADQRSEKSLIYLSELFGHSSVSITRRYIGLQNEVFSDMYLSL
jgi:integrase